MSKKQRIQSKQQTKLHQQLVDTPAIISTGSADLQANAWSIYGFKLQALIVALLAFAFYFNSFFNEYALDDNIVIVRNEYVQEGFSGIYDILTKDAYDSYYKQLNTNNVLQGGRYRPLSIVTFAIEQQFMGAVQKSDLDSTIKQNVLYGIHGKEEQKLKQNMHIRHFFNVLWYMLSVIALLYCFRYIFFKNNPIMAFVAAIIFTIHPLHTEVVANVKSRDEIMSLLFICLTFIFTFKYQEYKKKWFYAAALGSYFLAFLSKEYAITLVVLLPLSLYLFNGNTIKKSILAFIPFCAIIGIYMMLRLHTIAPIAESSDNEVLNNPYLFATPTEAVATKISTALNYIKLLIFPHPLSADYSYNSIPYKDFGNLSVWLSALIYAGMVAAMFLFLLKKPDVASSKTKPLGQNNYRSILGFALAFYLLHFILICNLVFNIGGTMGERLIYHSSVGFAMIAAFFIFKGAEKIRSVKTARIALAGFMAIMILLAGYKTMIRNPQWKNDYTLFSEDIKTVPNSVLVLGNLAASEVIKGDIQADSAVRKRYLVKAIDLFDRALTIHPRFAAGYLNRGITWYKMGETDKAKRDMDSLKVIYPTHPTLPVMYKVISDFYLNNGCNNYGKNGKYPEAIQEFKKGLAIDSTNVELWYNMGGALFSAHQYTEAANAWENTLRLKPDYALARQGLQAALAVINTDNKTLRAKK